MTLFAVGVARETRHRDLAEVDSVAGDADEDGPVSDSRAQRARTV
ncbi:hypothetical protein [Streptomyces sp. RB13]